MLPSALAGDYYGGAPDYAWQREGRHDRVIAGIVRECRRPFAHRLS